MASGAGGTGGGAGGGGGEIPRRRCHRRSTEPYQQGRQRPQDILNRVRVCVKNIVPQWLQSYFSRNEDVCSCSTARTEPPQCPVNEDERVVNDDEESANIHDGRITPEPTVSNTEDPATSTTSNCPPVLMTPSLHRRHLNSCMLESPALNCQPSTSSASPMGSSGFSVVNETKDSTSQHDDSNISTTGGLCSRACAKGASQNTSVPLLQSIETERHSLSRNAATSSRTPALNVSAYRSLSQSFGKSSMPKTSHLVYSRLYPVKTRYGGAAGFIQEPKVRNTPYQVDRQYPIERLMTRKSVSIAGNRTAYFQPSLTALGELRKTNQRIDRKLSTENETNTTIGQKREQEESGVCHTNFSMSAASGLPCGEGGGGGNMNHKRMGFVATQHPEEKEMEVPVLARFTLPMTSSSWPTVNFGLTVNVPVAKTAELSGSSSVSEPVTSGSDIGVSKNTAVPPLWPVETDHYHTLSQHTATSSKKPAFNMCRVSRIPQLIGKPSILKTRDFGDSPFYPGKTRYGGAAAVVRQPKVRNTPYQVPVRRQMKTKQLNTQSCGVMSLTAQRILRSLEMSTPLLTLDKSGMDIAMYFQAQRQKTGNDTNTTIGQKREQEESVCHTNFSVCATNGLPCGEGSGGDEMKHDRMGFVATKHPEEEIGFAVSAPVAKTAELSESSSVSEPVTSGSDTDASKDTSVLPLWFAETDRYRTLSQDTATSSKKPAFNVSVFGRISLAPVRRQKKVQQLNIQSCDVTSLKVQRIFQCLEMFTSPLLDVKRIPFIVSPPLKSPRDMSELESTRNLGAKRRKVDSQYPPVQRLIIPKPASIARNPTVYFKGNLTTSGEFKKTNQRTDKKLSTACEKDMIRAPNTGEESISRANGLSCGARNEGNTMTQETTGCVATKHPETACEKDMIRAQNTGEESITRANGLSCGGSNESKKMTQETTGHVATKRTEEEEMEVPVFPSITIPMTGSSLPPVKFSLSVMTSSPSSICPAQSLTNKLPNHCTNRVGVILSVPIAKTAELSGSSSSSEPITSRSSFTSLKPDTVAAQPTTTGPGVCARPAISSFSSSGMGLSENLKTRLSWQCDPYLHMNKVTDNKSITCHSTKLPPSDSAKQNGMGTPSKSGRSTLCASETDFQDKLKPAVGTCDCDTWLVQNQWEATKCVACETPKPEPGVKRVLTLPVASESAVTATASSSGCTVTTGALRFRRKSKRPVGSWQCPLCCDYNNAEDKKCVTCICEKPVPASKFSSSSSVPVSLSSGGRLVLKKFEKPEGSWDCEMCLVPNKADATKCVACESAKTGTNSALKGIGTSSSSSNPAAPSFKSDISSTSSGPSQTLTSFESVQFGGPGGLKGDVSSDSGSLKSMSEGFKFSKPTAVFKLGLSSDSKPEQVKKDSKNDNNFKFGLPSDLSHPASIAPSQCGANVYHLGQQGKKETGPQASSVGFSLGTGVINPTPAATSTIVTSADKNSFSFETVETKGTSVAPFPCKESEAKKDKRPAAKGQVTFGNMDPAPMPSASSFVWGAKSENQPEAVPSASLLFEKTTDKEEPKSQPMSERKDQSSSNPVFSSLNKSSSNTSPPATSATGSITDSSTCLSRAPVAASVYGQGSTVSTSAFGISPTSTSCQSLVFSKDSKRATTPNEGPAVTPGVSGPGARSSNTAQSDFISGATTTPRAADFSFVVDTGPSVPSTSRKFVLNRTPIFGQSQGASRPNPPGFRSRSSSDALFSGGSQPSSPTLGTVSSSCQPPVFGQQPGHSAPASKFSSSSVPVSLSSGGRLVLKKFKKPEGSWDCEVCLVQNKADATKCVACESAKPGTNSALKGIGTSSSSSNPAAPSFKSDISSTSSGPSQTLTSFESVQFGGPGGLKGDVSSDSGSLKSMSEGFKFSKPTAVFKLGLSSDSKPEQVKKDSKNDNNFKFGLPSDLSHPASLAPSQCGANVYHLGQQGKKETGPQASSVGFSLGTGVINPTPAATSTIVTSADKNSFSFETVETKGTSVAPFPCKESEAKKDKRPAAKGQVTFGNMDPAPMPSASSFVWGAKSENQPEAVPSASLLFEKTTDKEEPKSQPMSERKDQSSSNPVFSSLNKSSSNTSPPATSATGSITDSSTCLSRAPVAASVYGQGSTVSTSAFGISPTSTSCQSLVFSKDSKRATTPNKVPAVTPGVSSPGARSSNTAQSDFISGATTTPRAADFSFVVDTGPSVPSTSRKFVLNRTPIFGQSQGASWPNPPGFRSRSSSDALFSAGSQPSSPTLGTVSSSCQPPVFGQQPGHSAPASKFSSSSVPVSLSSGGRLVLKKFKKPEGSWDCEVCLVQNKADATKCVACESAKPGTNSALKGIGTSSSSSNPAAPSFKSDISSTSSGPSQTLTSFESVQFGGPGGLKGDVSSDSGSLKSMSEGFKFSKPTAVFKLGLSSDSKPEQVKKDSKNDNNFKFGLPSDLSHPASLAPSQCGANVYHLGQQGKKETGPQASSVGFSLGTGVINPTPAATSTIVTSADKNSFSFETVETKGTSVAPFPCKESEAKKDKRPAAKGQVTFGNMDPAPMPSASSFVWGAKSENQPEAVPSASLLFEKTTDKEEPKSQPMSERKDQSSSNPVFSSLNKSSSNTSPPATSATGSITDSSTCLSRAPVAASVYGQGSTVSTSAFGISPTSTSCQSLVFSKDSKRATTPNEGPAVTPGVSSPGARSSNTAQSDFISGATTTPRAADFSFVVDTGPSVPSTSRKFVLNRTPIFGQSQGASWPNPPGFRSRSSSDALFSAGSQPSSPTLGTVSSSCQPPVFGQQPGHSAPASKFSSSSVPVSLSSGGRLVLKKFKKPEGSWDCEVCLVQNKADATKCVACESAKPGTNSALKGFGTSSSSSNPAAPSFKFEILSPLSGPSQTLTNTRSVQFGSCGGLKTSVSTDSGSSNPNGKDIKFSKAKRYYKFRVSSESKPEQVKKDSKNDNNFKFGLPSGLSHPASLAPSQCGANVYHLGQQGKKETGPQASSVGFSLGTGVINPTPAATSTIVTSADKNSFSFETVETKGTSVAPFPCKESEAKKDKRPAAKGQVTFGNTDPAPMPSASSFVWGAKSENQPEAVPSASLLFEKTTDKEEPKSQPMSERKGEQDLDASMKGSQHFIRRPRDLCPRSF